MNPLASFRRRVGQVCPAYSCPPSAAWESSSSRAFISADSCLEFQTAQRIVARDRTATMRPTHQRVGAPLIRCGASADEPDVAGNRPTHYAARAGQEETLLLLIAHKADLAAKNAASQTPLDLAVQLAPRGRATGACCGGSRPRFPARPPAAHLAGWTGSRRRRRRRSANPSATGRLGSAATRRTRLAGNGCGPNRGGSLSSRLQPLL